MLTTPTNMDVTRILYAHEAWVAISGLVGITAHLLRRWTCGPQDQAQNPQA
ncbi:hypothetical protein Hanom_Chr14g01253781 [Helianthus anomalus]